MTSPQTKIVLLSVDDETHNNDLMARVFKRKDRFDVITVLSGSEGLKILDDRHVDVALVDFSMPKMNGVEFLEAAKKKNPEIIGVMVTGYPELRDVFEAQDRGLIAHVVAKPWRVDDLVDTVERALRLRDMKDAVAKMRRGQ
ncbi:MAG: hypothetical protein A2289_10690 [Deltaproteobacteria bacterium RIFOXYA12_FULL_58_15]|nr:MAG: hypothetical protein A2289_10690 [Deltaproteobacteria bacterium RIFOXYA12_FULL_58_15]OGR07991.1 MAG: hypothetical protein A2341_04090 [Deltaproteobacteria bacterium RIFOXYB12_FULL_58_9]